MNLDSIEDVLSDYNTLNLHKLNKIKNDIIIKDRTDLASTRLDYGQNFIYANYEGPLEINPRNGKYELFDSEELVSKTYTINNKTDVTRYTELIRLTGVRSNLASGNYNRSKYTLTLTPTPNVENITSNFNVTSNNSEVSITKEDTWNYTIDLSNVSYGSQVTITYTDTDDRSRSYIGTGVTGSINLTVSRPKLTGVSFDLNFTELSSLISSIIVTPSKEPTEAECTFSLTSSVAGLSIVKGSDNKFTISISNNDSFTSQVTIVTLTLTATSGSITKTSTRTITVRKES